MAAKSTKQRKKDQSIKSDPSLEANNKLIMVTSISLLKEHQRALYADFRAFILTLEAKLNCIQATVSDQALKIALLESSANLQDECLLALETTCAILMDRNAKLLVKVTDLRSPKPDCDISQSEQCKALWDLWTWKLWQRSSSNSIVGRFCGGAYIIQIKNTVEW